MTTNHEGDTLWAQRRYDSGLYDCEVHDQAGGGRLTVTLVGNISHVIHEEPVTANKEDVEKWRDRCVSVINNPDLRKDPV